MSLFKNNNEGSIKTGFDFGFDRKPHVSQQAVNFEHDLSDPQWLSHDVRHNTGTPRSRHFRKYSTNPSVHSATTLNPRPYFRSRRIKKGTIARPELNYKDPRGILITVIPLFGFVVGLTAIALLAWTGYSSVKHHTYCEVFTDDFSNGFNSTIWTKDVETGGYG